MIFLFVFGCTYSFNDKNGKVKNENNEKKNQLNLYFVFPEMNN